MTTVSNLNSARPDSYAPANYQSAHVSQSSVAIQSTTAISLVTADGDKVTLNAGASLQASLQTYDYLGRTQGQTVAAHGEIFQLASASGYAVTVEGTLDQAELADIGKLLDAIAASGNDLLSGKTASGLKHLAKIDDLGSIASFAADINYTRQVSVISSSQVSSALAPPTASAANSVAPAATNVSQSLNAFLDQLARLVEKLQSDTAKETMPKRFEELLAKIARHLPLSSDEVTLAERIRSEHAKSTHGHHAGAPAQH